MEIDMTLIAEIKEKYDAIEASLDKLLHIQKEEAKNLESIREESLKKYLKAVNDGASIEERNKLCAILASDAEKSDIAHESYLDIANLSIGIRRWYLNFNEFAKVNLESMIKETSLSMKPSFIN